LKVYGVDFTCAPRRAKPITVASAVLKAAGLHLQAIEKLQSFGEFESFLARPGPWIGGFDFPFSLPRELVRDLGWPDQWAKLLDFCFAFSRQQFREALDAYRATRETGRKYAHRATDLPAGSSSPMKLVNPPVALMFHEGARRLLASGVEIPSLMNGDKKRVALEAYPGLLVRKQLGIRVSYKSDTRAEHTESRRLARKMVVRALKAGKPLGIRMETGRALEKQLIEDGSGDCLDAAICAVQAAWAWARHRRNYGLPAGIDPLEGWIVTS
jgi:hypothetical protein